MLRRYVKGQQQQQGQSHYQSSARKQIPSASHVPDGCLLKGRTPTRCCSLHHQPPRTYARIWQRTRFALPQSCRSAVTCLLQVPKPPTFMSKVMSIALGRVTLQIKAALPRQGEETQPDSQLSSAPCCMDLPRSRVCCPQSGSDYTLIKRGQGRISSSASLVGHKSSRRAMDSGSFEETIAQLTPKGRKPAEVALPQA